MCIPVPQAAFHPSRATARTGIVLIAHAPLASAFAQVAGHVLDGSAAALAALDVRCDCPREEAASTAETLAASMGCAELLVLVDIHGGPTPCAVAQRLCESWGARARLLGGLNVPMLLTALECSRLEVGRLAQVAAEAGRRSVVDGLPF